MLLAHLLDASLRSLLLAAGAAAVLWFLRKEPNAAVSHAVWTVVLCGMLLVFALGPVLPPVPLLVPHATAPIPAAAVAAVSGAAPRAAAGPPAGLTPAQHAAPTPGNPPPEKRNWREIASFLYLSIALAFFARLLLGWLLVRKLARSSTPIRDAIYESSSIAVPLTVGSKILLPAGWREWDDATLAAVLAHEQAHVRRRDSLVAFASKLNRCLFWFHPLAWFLERKLALLAEQACDESSLLAIGNRDRYARILLDMAGAVETAQGRVAWHAVAMAKPSHIRQRIEAILNDTHTASRGLTRTGWAALLLAGVPLVYGAAAIKLERLPAPLALPFPAWSLPVVPAGALQATAPARVVFRDDFDGTLKPGWQWTDPKGDCTKSLDVRPGFLRITVVDYHDLWPVNQDYYAPLLLREVDGDFTLETKIAGPGRWFGGLLVWKDWKNFVRYERGVRFKNSLYLGANNNGQFVDVAWDYVEGDPMWLRLERKEFKYTASYSRDGKQWLPLKRLLTDMKPKEMPKVAEDTFSALKEQDFVFKPTASWTQMLAAGPLMVGLDAICPGHWMPHKVKQTDTDFDYFEIQKP